MKLKQRPQDFLVEEISSFVPDPSGRFFVYELEKRSLSTFEALAILARRARLRPAELSAAGLKDKHGATTQLFSAPRALATDTGDERLKLRFVGKCATPLTAASIVGNRFRLVLRALDRARADALAPNAAEIARFGVPNYYDDQRFGGNAHGQGFAARALALGNFEEALRLHLAAPHRKQSLRDKQNRRLARDLWGRWAELHARMHRGPERALVEFLRDNPGRYAEAFERITPSLRTMMVAAYQSLLFNLMLARMLEAAGVPLVAARNRGGEIPMHRMLDDATLEQWRELELPLPGGSTRPDDFPAAAPHLAAVLEQQGITLNQLRLSGLSRTRFKAARRRALMFPQDLAVGPPVPDELNPGLLRADVSFALGRGSFATIVAKRLVV